jgi:anaerobic selenocysteine-containing dehydrogenase
VHDPFMTATARYADIVLPAATYLETEDFYRSYGSYYMQYGRRAVEPLAEAWSNVRLTQALAARMGLTDAVFGMTQPEILKELFRGAGGAAAAVDTAALLDGTPVSIANRDGQKFLTPSGKLEFYAQSLADQGLPALPDWLPEPAEAGGYPLRLLTTPGYFQSHTAFSGVAYLRGREGVPCAVLHPADAAARGLSDGQVVRLTNDRGEIALRLRVLDEVQPGVVLVPGQRPDEEAEAGTVNMLCADSYTDLGAGATYQSTWLEVTAA